MISRMSKSIMMNDGLGNSNKNTLNFPLTDRQHLAAISTTNN